MAPTLMVNNVQLTWQRVRWGAQIWTSWRHCSRKSRPNSPSRDGSSFSLWVCRLCYASSRDECTVPPKTLIGSSFLLWVCRLCYASSRDECTVPPVLCQKPQNYKGKTTPKNSIHFGRKILKNLKNPIKYHEIRKYSHKIPNLHVLRRSNESWWVYSSTCVVP